MDDVVHLPEPAAPPALAALDPIERELDDVERSLARLDDGSYGTCEVCGTGLTEAQLAAAPASRFCPDHQPG